MPPFYLLSVEKKKKVKIYVAEDLLPEKPEKLFLKLKETDTIWLLTIPSGFSQDDPMDAEKVSKENESYKEVKMKYPSNGNINEFNFFSDF